MGKERHVRGCVLKLLCVVLAHAGHANAFGPDPVRPDLNVTCDMYRGNGSPAVYVLRPHSDDQETMCTKIQDLIEQNNTKINVTKVLTSGAKNLERRTPLTICWRRQVTTTALKLSAASMTCKSLCVNRVFASHLSECLFVESFHPAASSSAMMHKL